MQYIFSTGKAAIYTTAIKEILLKHIIILLCILFMRYICFSEIIIERKYRHYDFSKEKVLYIPIQLMSIEITDTVEIRERSNSTGLNVYANVAHLWDAYIKMNFKDFSGNNNTVTTLSIGRDDLTLDDTLLLTYKLLNSYEASYHIFIPTSQFLNDNKNDNEVATRFLLIINKLRISGVIEEYFKTIPLRPKDMFPKMEQRELLLGYVQFILFDSKEMYAVAYGDCDITVESNTSAESFLYGLSKKVLEKLPGF